MTADERPVRSSAVGAPTRRRVGWVDTGRGIAISLVVVYHTAQWLASPGFDTDVWQRVNDGLATLRMPLFFTIAGMYAGKWAEARWADLWAAKLSLFVWVYGVWCVVATLPFMLGLQMQGQSGNYLLLYRSLLTDPVRPRFELWFIWALALLFVVNRLWHRAPPRILIAITAVSSVLAFSVVDLGNPGWNGLLRYTFFFLAGMHGREALLRFGSWNARGPLVVIAGGWALLATVGVLTTLNSVPGYYFVTALLGVATGVTAARVLSRVGWIGQVGQQTLPIYLSHTSIILVLVWLIHLLPGLGRGPAPAAVLVPVVAGLALVLARVVHARIGHRPLLRLLYEQPAWLRDLPGRSRTRPARGVVG